ncbi:MULTISPECIES: hypothetical protein [Microbacterium]|uniref:hypothetical protein n=1 Tax=Microbacterium TaxID=33882 RepID=UPI00214B958C|nr:MULTISPECIES: hypothetical protein [unclassified Microbacterium]MCR2813614.1 hypothetical protein [Microbacterium sp. zg.Y1084]MDL5486571.1 hypothetical protein [Microbacterium sp. zg-Y1211]
MLRPHARRLRLRSKAATAVASVLLMVAGLVVATPAQAVPGAGAAPSAATRAVETAAVVGTGPAATGIVKAADLTKFQAGNIVSDAVFYNSGSMTEGQIQSFLNSKVTTCRSGHVCLKDKTDRTRAIAADPMCSAYTGGGVESAARILFKVAQACGINPQALIVMLQKEQGLVTDTWPVDSQYKIAMGQGCPDTAACDSRYFGFFNQVYGAAWQLKRYANPPGTSNYFTWYAPGKTWNVRWHPNASCGSSPVYITNRATAALYYYTPYQPNTAALRAGYGEGDGCSSYGNRNFYQYFEDWFGSTQGVTRGLVSRSGHIFVVSGGLRYGIPPSQLAEYTRVFGNPVPVSQQYLDQWELKGAAGAVVRNAKTGQVAYLQGGMSHWFGSCALVAAWGGHCNTGAVILAPEDYSRIREGAKMTWFARLTADGPISLIEGNQLVPMYDAAAATAHNGGSAPYAAVMGSATAARYTLGPTRFTAGQFIRTTTSTRVYLPTTDGRLIYLPHWAIAAELGLPSSTYRTVDPAVLSRHTEAGSLAPTVRCGDVTAFAAGGVLYPTTSSALNGFALSVLDAPTCGALTVSSEPTLDRVFVQAPRHSAVYLAENGVLRHVTSPSLLRSLGGGAMPRILPLAAAVVDRMPKGEPMRPAPPAPTPPPAPAPAPSGTPVGQMIRSSGSSQTYLATADGRAIYLPSWDIAHEWGFPDRKVTVVSEGILSRLRVDGRLGLFATCGADAVVAAGGSHHAIAAAAATGFDPTRLDAATCAMLPRSQQAVLSRVFVQGVGQSAVYLADQGVYRHVTSPAALAALGGGVRPPVLSVSPGTIARLPMGGPWR